MKVTRFNDFTEFYIHNSSFIESNRMLYVFLRKTMDQVIHGLINPLQYFTIEDNEMQVVVLRVPQICLIYSNIYKENSISILNQELEHVDLTMYYIAGNKEIVESFLKSNKVEYSTIKHLIIYKCDSISTNFKYAQGKMMLANPYDLESLIQFNILFNKEYSGEDVSYEEAKSFVLSGLLEENLFSWKYNNHLCSIAQVIYREGNDYPEIGHVFTDLHSRKKGFAPSLVHELTKHLINSGYQKCMLYTNGNNQASNKAFIKIGYIKQGEYIKCLLNRVKSQES